MNRFEYLEKLDQLLTTLPYDERREIMYDYEEHFKESLKDGKTDEEIIIALGSLEKIASQYATKLAVIDKAKPNQPNKQMKKPILKKPVKKGNGPVEILLLSFVAIIIGSLLLGPYIGLWAIVIAFFVCGIVFVFLGFTFLLSSIVSVPISFVSLPFLFEYPILLFTGSIALICIGGLILIITYYIVKALCYLTYYLIQWIIKLVRGY